MGFSLGDFIQSEKVELKKSILSEANFFIQNKRIYFVYKEMQLQKN